MSSTGQLLPEPTELEVGVCSVLLLWMLMSSVPVVTYCCMMILIGSTKSFVISKFSFFIRASYLYMCILTFSHLSLVRLVWLRSCYMSSADWLLCHCLIHGRLISLLKWFVFISVYQCFYFCFSFCFYSFLLCVQCQKFTALQNCKSLVYTLLRR